MNQFRFIHAADIHLGSLLHIDSPDGVISQYSGKAVYSAFERLCMAAVEQEVDFMLISGDLYDKDSKNVYANRFFIQMCEMLHNESIKVYVIAGNHDPLNKQWEYFKLPDNVVVFDADKHEVHDVKRNDETIVRIAGQSYKAKSEEKAVYEEFNMPGDGIFNIALLHTQLESGKSKYTPATAAELAKIPNIHYWALGHVHKAQIINRDKPVIAYPGIPQGRDFGEEGLGGAYLVEVNGTNIISMSHVTLPLVIYKTVEIDISSELLKNAESINELEDYISDTARSLATYELDKSPVGIPQIGDDDSIEGYVVRWVIKGRGELHNVLKDLSEEAELELARGLRDQLSSLAPFVWTDATEIRTSMPITEDILAEHSRIINMLDDTIKKLFEDKDKANSLKAEMGGLWALKEDPEDKDERKFHLDDEAYRAIAENAKQLILDELLDKVGE